jgi:hypothetical protein
LAGTPKRFWWFERFFAHSRRGESVETTQIYLNADLALKEKILAKTTPHEGRAGSYRPGDQLLAFLNGL